MKDVQTVIGVVRGVPTDGVGENPARNAGQECGHRRHADQVDRVCAKVGERSQDLGGMMDLVEFPESVANTRYDRSM